ncbi:MAG: LexA family protein [Methylococcaceae bacterium]
MSSQPTSRGGVRPGTGRKHGGGLYGEPTQPLRVPESLIPTIQALMNRLNQPSETIDRSQLMAIAERSTPLSLPLFASRVAAGFPSPADDHIDATLDLNEHLIKRPAATFFVRAQGDSMIGAGIHDGDLMVVDRSLDARTGSIVIAVVHGELTVKRLSLNADDTVWLIAENPNYAPIQITESMDLVIWGVVAHVIHSL